MTEDFTIRYLRALEAMREREKERATKKRRNKRSPKEKRENRKKEAWALTNEIVAKIREMLSTRSEVSVMEVANELGISTYQIKRVLDNILKHQDIGFIEDGAVFYRRKL